MKRILLSFACLTSLSACAEEPALDCANAFRTAELNQCASQDWDAARQTMEQYLEASLKHNEENENLVAAIKEAQDGWDNYQNKHCGAVYTQWQGGTIRDVMAFSCKTKLAKQRTHELWESFLTYMDDTPPVLPEPGQ